MNILSLVNLLQSYGGLLIVLCSVPIGYLLIRTGYSKQLDTIQKRVIAAQEVENRQQQAEIDDLKDEVKRLKAELGRQKRILHTAQVALKRRGLIINVDDEDFITLVDMGKNQTVTIPVENITTVDVVNGKVE